ncbi:MAG TPA: helix-turn-helix transcriptional regulator [Planctomycetota bacterium]|nr:helix-turn-helix transcriptional regulator [Planctomycetota bacterium]
MSRSGQPTCQPRRPVAVFALDFDRGASTGRHAHPFGQLVHAASGVMRVTSAAGTWIVPPQRAVWVPESIEHDVTMVTAVRMATVYVVGSALPRAPTTSCVVEVSPLLRELILEALQLPRPYPLGGAEERLIAVLLDAMQFRDVLPLHLPMPSEPHTLAIATGLQRDPADSRTLAAWAKATGWSSRTLARAFRDETGLTFGAWRAQLRLLRALELLAQRKSVTDVALSLGYDSTSAFVNRFRRHLGKTPARYFAGE